MYPIFGNRGRSIYTPCRSSTRSLRQYMLLHSVTQYRGYMLYSLPQLHKVPVTLPYMLLPLLLCGPKPHCRLRLLFLSQQLPLPLLHNVPELLCPVLQYSLSKDALVHNAPEPLCTLLHNILKKLCLCDTKVLCPNATTLLHNVPDKLFQCSVTLCFCASIPTIL